jgi:protein-L-isoaspartate(D-aspartate) O-methyltransferase
MISPRESTTTAHHAMISLLRARGIHDPRVIAAMASVPRERFLAAQFAPLAYADRPLPIDHEQTISQPYIVAVMSNALELDGDDRVLEVGTGTGYSAAVLSRIASEVYTIERIPDLAETARTRLVELGYPNVTVKCADGSLGWPEHAPYDAIAVTAASPSVPQALLDQLAIGGRLVIPIGDEADQELLRIIRNDRAFVSERLGPVRFVPLIGAQAWPSGTSIAVF